ncbi:helix-turn-helix domain-containing protein [Amycolatopsis japonica]
MPDTTPIPASFGAYVAQARTERSLSARQLAARMGIATTTVTRVESGEYAVPNPDLFLALVDALGLDLRAAVDLIEPYRNLCTRFANEKDHTT